MIEIYIHAKTKPHRDKQISRHYLALNHRRILLTGGNLGDCLVNIVIYQMRIENVKLLHGSQELVSPYKKRISKDQLWCDCNRVSMKEPSAVECIILTRCSIVVLPKLEIRDNLLTHLIQFSLTLQLFFFLTHIFFSQGRLQLRGKQGSLMNSSISQVIELILTLLNTQRKKQKQLESWLITERI